jgi:hypothetical protein
MRVPDRAAVELAPARAPTVAEASEPWRAARVDVAEGTRVLHSVALGPVVPILGGRRVAELTVEDVNELVRELTRTGRKRETIRKSVKYLAAVLEENAVNPNPARSKRVRLLHEEPVELEPPTAEHVEAVLRLLPRTYRLPALAQLVRSTPGLGRDRTRPRLRRAAAASAAARVDDQDACRAVGGAA